MLALHTVTTEGEADIVGLLTTVNSTAERDAMHGVRRTLLEAQAEALGLPLHVVDLPWPCPNEIYEARMRRALETGAPRGDRSDDLRRSVPRRCPSLPGGSPSRHRNPPALPVVAPADTNRCPGALGGRVRALITCVDPAQAPPSIAGRCYDDALLAELSDGVDPCGENGEFHTMVVDGPEFSRPLDVQVGETLDREGFLLSTSFPGRKSWKGDPPASDWAWGSDYGATYTS
jgi:Diphthamide synthase